MLGDDGDSEIAKLKEDLAQAQALLGFVLLKVGPVEITREAVEEGLHPNAEFVLAPDEKKEVLVVSIKNG